MHTIEASVLVPLGLGLISLMLMLAFFLHDQTVLTAEYASTVLEWQMCPGARDEDECAEEIGQWHNGLLITSVHAQSFSNEQQKPVKAALKINPCWLKRVWEVVTAG